MRSAELTLPGFVHDVCSAVQGTSTASPFFRALDLGRFGLELINPPAPLAHVLDGGRVAVLERSVAETAAGLGVDRAAYRRLMGPLVRDADAVMDLVLGPIIRVPRHPLAAARFGLPALRSAVGLARSRFRGEEARALLAGVSAHSMLRARPAPHRVVRARPGDHRPRLRLAGRARRDGAARRRPRRGAALARWGDRDRPPRDRHLRAPGGPRGPLRHDAARPRRDRGERLPGGYRRRLEGFRYGPGVVKLDWALSDPIPWRGRGGSPGRHGPRRRHARRDPGGRGGGGGRPSSGAAVRHRRPAEPLRPESGARGAPHRLGLLPRAERLDRRHDGADRGPGRALRARLPRHDPGALGPPAGRHGGVQPELRRRRHQRRASRTCASSSPGPSPGSTRTPRRPAASTSARRRPRRAEASTACAASGPPGQRSAGSSASGAERRNASRPEPWRRSPLPAVVMEPEREHLPWVQDVGRLSGT